MPACPSCGRPMPAFLLDGRLMATDDPPEVIWQGEPKAFHTSQVRILALMVRRGGKARRDAIEAAAAGPNRDPVDCRQPISNLRKRLAAQGVPLTLRAIAGWGYELVVVDARRKGTTVDGA